MAIVTLQPFLREDCAALAGWLSTPELTEMTAPDWTFPVSASQIEEAYFANPMEGELWKAVADGRMVGHAGIRIAGQVGHFFHVVVDPALHRQGYGRAMMERLLEMAFREREIHRISLYVFDLNDAAVAFYRVCGFQVEGRHRDHFCMAGRWHSTYSMALLRAEWERAQRGDEQSDKPLWIQLDLAIGDELIEAKRKGVDAAEKVLDKYMKQIDAEGDEDDRYWFLHEYMQLYADLRYRKQQIHGGDLHRRAIRIAERIYESPVLWPDVPRAAGEAMYRTFEDSEWGLRLIRRAYDQSFAIPDNEWMPGHNRIRAVRSELRILADVAPLGPRTVAKVAELHGLEHPHLLQDYFRFDTYRALVNAGIRGRVFREILQQDWAAMAGRTKWSGQNGWGDEMNDLEVLIEQIPPDPEDDTRDGSEDSDE